MIKGLIDRMFPALGVQLTKMAEKDLPASLPDTSIQAETQRDGLVKILAKDPLNAELHLQYAVCASSAGWPHLAYAQLKTAEYLGADRKKTELLTRAFRQALPDSAGMNHNLYFRLASLCSEITTRAGRPDPSVLDVGGGHGQLASFLPDASYCLAEPAVNGISGANLPFPDRSFDYVVSCHVLEHIPMDRRTLFLDQLLSKAKYGVILLNPFQVAGTHVEERLKLMLEITGAQWAKEHLDCTLPTIDDIKAYASQRGLQISIKPNGTLTTTMAFVFVDYFAAKSKRYEDLLKLNAFFNEKYINILDSSQYPNSHLIYFALPERGSAA